MQAMDGIDYFSVETMDAGAPSVGTIEIQLTGNDGISSEWTAPERKTLVASGFKAYLIPYPTDELEPPEPGHQLPRRAVGQPTTCLDDGAVRVRGR